MRRRGQKAIREREHRPRHLAIRRLGGLCALAAGVAIIAASSPAAAQSRASARPVPRSSLAGSPGVAYTTALQYVVRFYPRWFTYEQAALSGGGNRLAGPRRMTPLFGYVVAPNDDTLYASAFMNLAEQPMILTIPNTTATYSLLTVDAYGDIFQTNIPAATAGTYALTAPGWTGKLPAGVTQVPVPFVFSVWIIRADKFSADRTNETAAAEGFRASLLAATLSQYAQDHSAGATAILPVAFHAPRF
jgi:hypothetical protein